MAGEESGLRPRLIVGLGNPGRRYERTRHNVGFLVVDELARSEGLRWEGEKKWQAEVARGDAFSCMKPQTYMNLSGEAVAAYAMFYKLDAREILVIYDDADLDLGALRFRASGSAGGHRGVASIMGSLGSDQFARLKVGIGRGGPERGGSLADHVLSKFLVDEAPELEKSLTRAVRAVRDAHSQGLQAAMNEYNRKPPKAGPSKPEETQQ
jgi:PTH1 family peptidyl-tRNA hydrolase